MTREFGFKYLYTHIYKSLILPQKRIKSDSPKGEKMATITHQVNYTSMKCYSESNEWSASDEVYAIFVTADWQDSTKEPYLDVCRTKVYEDVDDGETKGGHNSSDNKRLWGDQDPTCWQQMRDFEKFFILVQAMEHDYSNPDGIVKLLQAVLPHLLKRLVLEGANRERILYCMTRQMKKIIDQAKNMDADVFSNEFCDDLQKAATIAFLGSATIPIILGLQAPLPPIAMLLSIYAYVEVLRYIDNSDDRIAYPKELISRNNFISLTSIPEGETTVEKRRTLWFAESGEGTKAFRFTLRGKTI